MLRTAALFLAPLVVLAQERPIEFNRDVRPILSDRCWACHGPDAPAKRIGLRLDSETASRAAIVPGDPAQSELIRRVTAENKLRRMPPAHTGAALSPDQIKILERWIAQGAKWQKHWAFLPPQSPALPEVSDPSWAKNPIDRFVLARLDRERIKPSPAATREVLIRRATLDLTGLPPTPGEVDAFLKDASENAYEKLLDRLLASSRYAERMAIRWLDAARYADTNGYQTDAEREMWRWRDWVIEAFDRNMPYDRFVVEQLAGDLLPNATLSERIATGFNRNHRGNSEGGIVPEEYLVEYAVDRVETMGAVFMGVTIGCARCHNHKYDPFTQREFYQLLAYFNHIGELGRYLKYGNTPPLIASPTPEQEKQLAALQAALSEAEKEFQSHAPKIRKLQAAWESSGAPGAAEWELRENLAASLDLAAENAHFDGAREANLGDRAAYGFYDKFTAAARIRAEGDGPIVTRAVEDDNGEGWGLYLHGGKLQVNLIKRRLDDSIRVETREKLAPGPHHVAFSYDGSRLAAGVRIYVDGNLQPLTVLLDGINQEFKTKEPLRAGAGGVEPSDRFRGDIYEVRAWSSVLTGEEVRIASGDRVPRLARAFLEVAAPAPVRDAWQRARSAREALKAFEAAIPTTMVMQEPATPADTFILVRGAYDRPGEKVERGVPEVLPPLGDGAPRNRLGLAQWLVSPSHPLTARVAVNRFWQMYFGTGLVKTAEDFGAQGDWPSHPELLDWLATEFIRSGWNVKQLQKTILMSATYRQSSNVAADLAARDPENRLLARASRPRLPAEMIRDQALYAAGLLVEKTGGKSVFPYQPPGLWSEIGTDDYKPGKGDDLYRRSLYTFWKRTAPPPFMTSFDSATRESCSVRETRTNTPLQALNLMNDVTFVEAARKLAERGIREAGREHPLAHAFRLVLARHPQPGELERLKNLAEHYRKAFAAAPEKAPAFLNGGGGATTGDAATLAAYTAVCSLILNLDEAVTRP